MQRPPRVLFIALISAIGGFLFLAPTLSGNNNWLMNSISTPTDSPGLLPVANAIGKDLMLDVSPQLHPSVFVGQSANQVKYQHWLDQDIHCEDCLKLEMPNTGNKLGVAFSSRANYNFEEATKVTFYVMVEDEEGGATFSFKTVGNDRDNGTTTNVPADDLFKNQEFALTSQNVTLNQSWNYFEMSLEGVQEKLSNVKYPFALELAQAEGDVIYVKGIVYSNEPILDQYLLEASSSDNMTASTMAVTTTTANVTALNVTLSDNATETVNAPATVEFNATVADGEEPYSFDWDFGDGVEDTEDTDGNAIHTFAEPGSYNVTVDVADSLNNTGSANTVVDVADEIVNDEEPAVTTTSPEGNGTQEDSQTTDSLNTTNTTAGADPTAADDDENLTEEEGGGADDGGNNTGSSTVAPDGEVTTSNSPPIANAGNDLTGRPNERVILDASKSTDPDEGDRIESYQWEQESGPTAAIADRNSQTPIVTLPDLDNDATLVFSLTVNDGEFDSEEQDTVSIYVDHIDEITGNVQTRILKPADIQTSEWIVAGDCSEQGHLECISDGSDATFVTAGIENIDALNLYSFGGFNGGGAAGAVVDPNTLVIERVAAEITAKKMGNTGYVSLAIDDPSEEEHYITPSISIASSSFQKHNYVWDANPLTGEEWTYDSLNSLVAGFKYDGGQSGVQISEIQLIISYSMPEPSPPAEGDTVEDTSDGEATENEQNDEDNTNAAAENPDDEEQQPAAEADSTNSTDSDANEEGSESEE